MMKAMATTTTSSESIVLQALQSGRLSARVIACDQRPLYGGWATETEYIVQIAIKGSSSSSSSPVLAPYTIAKSYAAFRRLTAELVETGGHTRDTDDVPPILPLLLLCQSAIASQPQRYIRKVWNTTSSCHGGGADAVDTERVRLVDTVMTTVLQQHHHCSANGEDTAWQCILARFLVTDVLLVDDEDDKTTTTTGTTELSVDTTATTRPVVVVVPLSSRRKRAIYTYLYDDKTNHANDDSRCSADVSTPGRQRTTPHQRPCCGNDRMMMMGSLFFAGAAVISQYLPYQSMCNGRGVAVVGLLIIAAMVAMDARRRQRTGQQQQQTVRVATTGTPTKSCQAVSPLSSNQGSPTASCSSNQSSTSSSSVPARQLAFLSSDDDSHDVPHHGWSVPAASLFSIRGPTYATDRVKVPSQDYLVPCRGVELYLTPPPHNDAPASMLEFSTTTPTLIVHCRLSWGVLLMYGTIPDRFVPYLKGSEQSCNTDPLLTTAADRLLARWFSSNDDSMRNQHLKIIPTVVDGPWIVQTVVGSTPALIGTKLPVRYHRSSASASFEIVLDITETAAARSILRVTRQYTTSLAIHLGFVLQDDDGTEECMLLAAGLHRVDPTQAPVFPE